MRHDYAKCAGIAAWLRHPVLGDASFDSFEHRDTAVHRSEAPYEWAVNGSLFRDPADGAWYCFAGRYPHGYQLRPDAPAHCVIHRSRDEGSTWENLGPAFERGFRFEGHDVTSDIVPDAVAVYDDETQTYWLAYDWVTDNTTWAVVHHPAGTGTDSGAALAWSTTPAGPWTRLTTPLVSNVALAGRIGRFSRMYATTLLKRRDDWIALVLCDSNDHFSWGLAALTAPTPHGPWSDPVVVLSVDRPEYFPAPVEFFPCFTVGSTIYAPATSVAASRNYQAVFAADRAEAHRPEGWRLIMDGSVWHSRPNPDEHYGIWGQTFHGFVSDSTLQVVYPAKDRRDHGVLLTAARPWDGPYTDGFTLSGHAGPAMAPLLAAYDTFVLRAELAAHGTIEIAFDYAGILGPDASRSDAVPHPRTLSGYSALRMGGGSAQLITVAADGAETVHTRTELAQLPTRLVVRREASRVYVESDGAPMLAADLAASTARPIVLITHAWSGLTCTRFEVEGSPQRYALDYHGFDALLGAGQRIADWESVPSPLFRSGHRLVGRGSAKAKWNIVGDSVALWAPRSPDFGTVVIEVDGVVSGQVDLHSDDITPSAVVDMIHGLAQGRHGITLRSETGAPFPLDVLTVSGAPADA